MIVNGFLLRLEAKLHLYTQILNRLDRYNLALVKYKEEKDSRNEAFVIMKTYHKVVLYEIDS